MSNIVNCNFFCTSETSLGFITIAIVNTLIFVITPSCSLPTLTPMVNQVAGKVGENGKAVTTTTYYLPDDPSDVKFFLYRDLTNPDKYEELVLNDKQSVRTSSFNRDDKTVFVIHGFLSNSSSGMPTVIKKGFFDAKVINNLILVDWGKLSTPNPNCPLFIPLAYPCIVTRNIPKVYKRVALFIQFLIDKRFTSLDKLLIIGHSLGAHVSGGAGGVIVENPKNRGKKIARISGLDPAGPLFQGIQVQRRLTKADAKFVDIYHTASGTLGTSVRDEGHANFLPNGGRLQPGCVVEPFFEAEAGSCSHAFVSLLYAASIQKNFTACRCDPEFQDAPFTMSCPGECAVSVLAGYPCPSDARGQFYFETGEDPFAADPEPQGILNMARKNTHSIHDKSVSDDSRNEEEDDNGDENEKDIKVVNGVLNIG